MLDLVILNIVKKKYVDMQYLMNYLDKNDTSKIIVYFTCVYKLKKIDDDSMFILLYLSLKKYKINELNIEVHNYQVVDNSFEVVKINIQKYKYEMYIMDLLDIINKSDGQIRFKFNKLLPDINLFNEVFEKIYGMDIIDKINSKYDDIKSKLYYIRSYFGLNLLIYFGLNIITVEQFDKMTEEKQQDYYDTCCLLIVDKLNKIQRILTSIFFLKRRLQQLRYIYTELVELSQGITQITDDDLLSDIVDDFMENFE